MDDDPTFDRRPDEECPETEIAEDLIRAICGEMLGSGCGLDVEPIGQPTEIYIDGRRTRCIGAFALRMGDVSARKGGRP